MLFWLDRRERRGIESEGLSAVQERPGGGLSSGGEAVRSGAHIAGGHSL
jgi:hypothetical protein